MAVTDDDARGGDPWKDRLWVRILCDFSADAVWNIDGEACDIDDLPISDQLSNRLRNWQRFYDEFSPCYDPPSDRWDVERFSDDGRALAQEVKRELPNWTVIYFDEAKAAVSFGDRCAFEYEILL